MITVYSPRIHNLGDFAHCLPALSGLYKKTGQKISFGIGDKLQIFKGIKELLLKQEMFGDVYFMSERPIGTEPYIIVDDHGPDSEENISAKGSYRNVNYLNKHYNLGVEIDNDFELIVPECNDYRDKIIIGDRWSPSECPNLDVRRQYNVLKNSGKFNGEQFHYLDYTQDLVYNCSIIKSNPNALYTTFTGIGILSDLMNKETYVLWDDDMEIWDGKPVDFDFDLHYSKNRKSHLKYIKDFNWV